MLADDKSTKTLLYESEVLKEAFGVIAHQWRQPLSHINALVSSIDNRLYELAVSDTVVSKQLLEIEKITKEMSKSIDNYRGYLHRTSDYCLIRELFEGVQKNIEHLLRKREISLDINIEEDLKVSADVKLLEELIVTIINNSRDALLSRNIYKPEIKLSAWSEEAYLFIKICDNAGGMSKSVKQKIFEPNFTTKHSSEGTGVGLFMVKKLLAEKMNGDISVKNVENGACFTLKLPRKYDE